MQCWRKEYNIIPLVKTTKMEMLNLLLLIISSTLQRSFKKQLNGLRLVSEQCSGYNYYIIRRTHNVIYYYINRHMRTVKIYD